MNWIEVADRLPESREIVENGILFTDGETIYFGAFQDDGDGDYQFMEYGGGTIPKITHWLKPTLPTI